MDLLFDDGLHATGQLVAHWIQKGKLGLYLLLGELAHSDKLPEKPLVHLAQLSQLYVHVLLVDNVDKKIPQTLVKLLSEGLRVSRFANNFLLLLIGTAIDSNFLRVEVESRQTDN